MGTVYSIHPENPQKRIIEHVVSALRLGAVMLYPTDTVYAIGCDLQSKAAITKVRQIKQLSNDKPLTFLCSSLSNIAAYAQVSDHNYKLMRRLIPGPFTFILPATKLVPKLVMNPKRRTTGIRVPDHPLCQALLSELGNPIISTSAHQVNELNQDLEGLLYVDAGTACHVNWEQAELFAQFDHLVDLILDDGSQPRYQVSTILDLTGVEPVVTRPGLGWELVDNFPVVTTSTEF